MFEPAREPAAGICLFRERARGGTDLRS